MAIEIFLGVLGALLVFQWLNHRAQVQRGLAERKAQRIDAERRSLQCKERMDIAYTVLKKSSAAYIEAAEAALGKNYWWLTRETLLARAPHLGQPLYENDRAQADYDRAERAWALDGGADPKEYDGERERNRQECRELTRRYIDDCFDAGFDPYETPNAAFFMRPEDLPEGFVGRSRGWD